MQPIWLSILIAVISGLVGALIGVFVVFKQINAQTYLNLLNVVLESHDERNEFVLLFRNLKDAQGKKGDLNNIRASIVKCYDHAWFIVLFARDEIKERDFKDYVEKGHFGEALNILKSLITGKEVSHVT